MAQLAEGSLLTTDDLSSNPVIFIFIKYIYLLINAKKTKLKKKIAKSKLFLNIFVSNYSQVI